MDESLLDNAIWHALGGPQAAFRVPGGRRVRRYEPAFAAFAATERETDEAALRAEIPPGAAAILFTSEPLQPEGFAREAGGPLLEMLATTPPPTARRPPFRRLGADDVPAVQALVKLTQPGPFFARTMELGDFFGIFEGGQLVAIAGERLRLPGFAEVSAVATHPDHRGRGYAKVLISAVMESMASRGDRAFLHVWPDNVSAIAAYTALGFLPRRLMHVAMLRRVMET